MHVVVGSGTTGTVLTLRLLEVCDVLLISEGDDSDPSLDPLIAHANRWGAAALYDHARRTELTTLPDPSRDGRVQVYPRGLGAGGTSNINAMLCTAGSAKVFDEFWPDGWGAFAMDPYLMQVECLSVTEVRCQGGLFRAIQRLCLSRKAGQWGRSDLKSRLWERGTNASYFGFVNGDRRSLLGTRLSEASLSGRLQVLWNSSAVRLLYHPGTNDVSGVMVRDNRTGRRRFIRRPPAGEIVLCAGVFESPRLLVRSNLSTLSLPQFMVKSTSSHPVPLVQLPIGDTFVDHSVVPVIGLGNWWSTETGSQPIFPENSVHGWINLDGNGRILQPGDEQPAW